MRPVWISARFQCAQGTPPSGHSFVRLVAVAALIAVTVGVRGAYWLEIRDDSCYLHPKDDVDVMLMYNESCRLSNTFRSLAGWSPIDYFLPPTVSPDSVWRAEGYFRNTTPGAFIRPPGYTIFLAVVFMFFHETPQVLFLLQMLMGLATLLLLFLFARRLFGFWPAWTATFCLGIHWTTVYYENVLHAPVLTSLLLMTLLNCVARLADNPRNWWFVGVGAALGAVCVSATTMLLFSPLLGTWTAWVLYGHERRRRPLLPSRALLPRWALRTLGQGMLMLATMLLVMSPITISNSVASGKFYLLSQGFWFHLAVGNYPGQEGSHMDGEDTSEYGEWSKEVDRTIRAIPGAMRVEDIVAMAREAVAPVIAADPMRFLRFCVLRAFWFWGPWEYTGAYAETQDRMVSGVLARLPWWFGWVVACGAAGLALLLCDLAALLRRGSREGLLEIRFALRWLPVLVIPAWMFPHVISFMSTSHRMPVVPLVFLFSGFAAVEIPRRLLARQWTAPCLACVCAVIVAAVSLRVPEPWDDGTFPENRIAMDLNSGDLARAWQKMDRFIRQNPVANNAEGAALKLCAAREDLTTAVAFYILAANNKPDDNAYAGLLKDSVTQLTTEADKPLREPREGDLPELWMAHGLALLNRCDEAGAIPVFDRIARLSRRQSLVFSADILSRVLRGGNEPAEGNSGAGAESSACRDIVLECAVNSLERCGSLSKAAALLEEMGLHPPGAAGWLVRRARLLRQAGDDRLAVAAYADALEKGASDPVINELHELMEARIAKEERSVLWQEIIRRNPNRVPLYLRLGRTLDAEEKRDEAQAAYREAFRLDGESPTCRLYLAQSLAGSGALDEALALAEQTDPLPDYLRPELAETYAIAGRYCISKDDWTRAASLFEKAITILPDNLWHKCWLAEAMVNLDRVDEARPLIFEILAAEPANQMALTLLQRVEEKPAAGGSN